MLTNCPHCDNQIAPGHEECPFCGHDLIASARSTYWVTLIVSLLIGLLLVAVFAWRP